MNKSLKTIKEYLDNAKLITTYDEKNSVLSFPIFQNENGETIKGCVEDRDELIYTYVQIRFKFSMQEAAKQKMSEYLHRANFNMIRGNFEYDLDNNLIRFKYYFDKSIIRRKNYTLYNILVPASMFQKYFFGMLEIAKSGKSPKEIIENIESMFPHYKEQ